MFVDGRPLNPTTRVSARDAKLWSKSLTSVLTPAQLTQYREIVDRRRLAVRATMVKSFTARANQELLLSEQQQEELSRVLDSEFGPRLAATASEPISPNIRLELAEILDANPRPAPIEHEKLAFLSESQRLIWAQSFERELHIIGRRYSADGKPRISVSVLAGLPIPVSDDGDEIPDGL